MKCPWCESKPLHWVIEALGVHAKSKWSHVYWEPEPLWFGEFLGAVGIRSGKRVLGNAWWQEREWRTGKLVSRKEMDQVQRYFDDARGHRWEHFCSFVDLIEKRAKECAP